MKKTNQNRTRLQLQKQSVRVLSTSEVARIAGALRNTGGGGDCCIQGTELISPYSQPPQPAPGCCIQGTELISPYSR